MTRCSVRVQGRVLGYLALLLLRRIVLPQVILEWKLQGVCERATSHLQMQDVTLPNTSSMSMASCKTFC